MPLDDGKGAEGKATRSEVHHPWIYPLLLAEAQ